MLQKVKKKLKFHSKGKADVQPGSSQSTVALSDTISHASGTSTNPPSRGALTPCDPEDSIVPLTPAIPASSELAPPIGNPSHQLLQPASPNNASALSISNPSLPQSDSSTLLSEQQTDDSTNTYQPLVAPSSAGFFQNAHTFSVSGGTFMEVHGNLSIHNHNPDDALPQGQLTSMSTPPSWIDNVLRAGISLLKTLTMFTGAPTVNPFIELLMPEPVVAGKDALGECCKSLMRMIEPQIEGKGSKVSQQLKDSLRELYSALSAIDEEIGEGEDNEILVKARSRRITQAVDSFVLINCISGAITMADAVDNVGKQVLRQIIRDLPRVEAAHNDYGTEKKNGLCFEGTREALLREIAEWVCTPNNPQVYLLSGIAGVGKSTIAYTVAERAKSCGYLGASFFFSRDEVERSNAKKFFTTIAFQLSLYSEYFSQAIERALQTRKGTASVTKGLQEQLEALMLEPFEDVIESHYSPIIIVVDALDECNDQDGPTVLLALDRLVQAFPHFKVIVTTRPQPHLPHGLYSHRVFYLQNIEEKIVNGDIQLYLNHSLSWELVRSSLPNLGDEWRAEEEDVEALVLAAGRLFIMASTAVRFILDVTASDPRYQMELLKTDGRVSLDGLGNFYSIILRQAVPPHQPRIAQRFKDIVGIILVIQEPLSIGMLQRLTQPWPLSAIKAVLANLQSVVMLTDDTPRIYHKSFFDFLTDPHRCAEDFRIDLKAHHTRAAISCFKIMNMDLKQNILGLGTPARFMDNDSGRKADDVSAERFSEKIVGELQYACTYWASHLENADTGDFKLIKEADSFVKKHLLHWLESLSLIGRLETATHALRIISNFMKSASFDTSRIVYDAQRFIGKFYGRIHESALHTYYSALHFTPTESFLRKRYSKEMAHGLCRPEGFQAHWDALITHCGDGLGGYHIVFSSDGSRFASSEEDRSAVRLWDAEHGTPLQTFEGDTTALAGDFSVAAVSKGRVVTLWRVADNVPISMVTLSEGVTMLALSFDGARFAVGLPNGTIGLWDSEEGELIASLGNDWRQGSQLSFSPQGSNLAFLSKDGTIQLWDGHDGEMVARLDYKSKEHTQFVFSRDGSQLVSMVEEGRGWSVTLWDGENGDFIDIIEEAVTRAGTPDDRATLAISEDGSLIATAGDKTAQIWSGSPPSLVYTHDVGEPIRYLAISGGILAAAASMTVVLYDVNDGTKVSTIKDPWGTNLAFSPDCTRLAVGGQPWKYLEENGSHLFDVLALNDPVHETDSKRPVVALAFSPDSSRLASALLGGTIELWDATRTKHPLATHKLHSQEIDALKFALSGEQFLSASSDGKIKFWDGMNGAPIGELEHSLTGKLLSVALSSNLLAASTGDNIALFEYKSLRCVDTLNQGGHSLSFLDDGSLLAFAYDYGSKPSKVFVWNVAERATIATFAVTIDSKIHNLIFSPDGSQLAVHVIKIIQGGADDSFRFFDIQKKDSIELAGHEDISWIPNFINGFLVTWNWDGDGERLVAQFPGRHDWIPVLWLPTEFSVRKFAVGSSQVVALGCDDGRILFVRFPTTSTK